MAASAAAAIASSFSSVHSPKRLKLSTPHLFRPISSHPFSVSQKWQILSVSAAVAQDEAVMSTETSRVLPEETAEETGEVVAGEETVGFASTKLYFGNLPYSVDSSQLAAFIQDYGSPEMIEVLYDRNTERSRGFAFVTMSSIEDCNDVIQNLDGNVFMGRTLRVNFSDKPKPKEPLYPETEFKLFIGNLSWSVASERSTQAFQEYGNVVGARVLYDSETGKSRGYGFVCYSTKAEMESALEFLNGVELEGRAIWVSLAEGKRAQG